MIQLILQVGVVCRFHFLPLVPFLSLGHDQQNELINLFLVDLYFLSACEFNASSSSTSRLPSLFYLFFLFLRDFTWVHKVFRSVQATGRLRIIFSYIFLRHLPRVYRSGLTLCYPTRICGGWHRTGWFFVGVQTITPIIKYFLFYIKMLTELKKHLGSFRPSQTPAQVVASVDCAGARTLRARWFRILLIPGPVQREVSVKDIPPYHLWDRWICGSWSHKA